MCVIPSKCKLKTSLISPSFPSCLLSSFYTSILPRTDIRVFCKRKQSDCQRWRKSYEKWYTAVVGFFLFFLTGLMIKRKSRCLRLPPGYSEAGEGGEGFSAPRYQREPGAEEAEASDDLAAQRGPGGWRWQLPGRYSAAGFLQPALPEQERPCGALYTGRKTRLRTKPGLSAAELPLPAPAEAAVRLGREKCLRKEEGVSLVRPMSWQPPAGG